MGADFRDPMQLGASDNEGVKGWIGYGAIYVQGGQQSKRGANEQRARASFASRGNSDAGLESRADGNFEYVNKRLLEYLGAPLSEVVGWGWMDKVHPDDINQGKELAPKSQNPENLTMSYAEFEGRTVEYRWFEVRGEPLRASDGAVLSWYGVLIDIDDRRTAEEALRESEFKLRQIIETVPSLLLVH